MSSYEYDSKKKDVAHFANLIMREKRHAWNEAIDNVLELIDENCTQDEGLDRLKKEIRSMMFPKETIDNPSEDFMN